MKRRNWRWGVYLIPLIAIAVFSGTLVEGLHRLSLEKRVIKDTEQTGAWVAAQAGMERLRLLETLERYYRGDPAVDGDALLLRFDLFWSRVPLLISGNEAKRLREHEGIDRLIADLQSSLKRLEPIILALRPGDGDGYAQIRRELDRFEAPLHELMQVSMAPRALSTEIAEAADIIERVQLAHGAAVLSGALVIILLLYKTRRSAALQRAYKDAADDAALSSSRLSDALQSISEGFVLFGPDERLILCNERYRELYEGIADLIVPGTTYAELARAGLARGLTDFDGQDIDERIEQERHRRTLPAGPAVQQKVGERWIQVVDRRTADGGFVGVRTDITALKQVEQGLLESESRFRSIIDNSPNAIFLKDSEGRYRVVNRRFAEWMNTDMETIVGKTTHDVLPTPLADRLMAQDREVLRWGTVVESQREFESAGVSRTWRFIKFPVFAADGRPGGVAAICEDVTDERAAQMQLQQAQKMEAVGQLTGGVAHDFNNLLMAISGNLDLIGDRVKGDAEALDFLDTAVKATNRGADLTRRLLAFSRQQVLMPKATEVNDLIQNVTDQLLRRTLREDIEIETRLDPRTSRAMIDPVQLESALLNLAINARDAMERGGRLTITSENATLDPTAVRPTADLSTGDYVVVSVADTGQGMSPDVMARAFEPFFTTKGVSAGSGLGLSMVYGFAKQSGGHVTLESAAGQGTMVRIFLPAAAGAATGRKDGEAEAAVSPLGRGNILVVEDDAAVRAYVVTALRQLGYTVHDAKNGPEALAHIETIAALDLLLTDVVLPFDMSGPKVAVELRQHFPDAKTLFMSGYADGSIVPTPQTSDDFPLLQKPFTRAELASRVRDLLAEKAEPSIPFAPRIAGAATP